MRLVVSKNNDVLKEFNIAKSNICIGRLPISDVCLPDSAVSRRHALISAVNDGKWAIEDLASANKSYLNGQIIEKAEINTGDVIKIADFNITVYLEDNPSTPEAEAVQDGDASQLEASLTTPQHETVVRKPDASHAPAMRLAAKRLTDFNQATEALCEADSLDKMMVTLVDITLKQFSAFRVWCALREQPSGPLTYQAGKRRDGKEVKLEDLQLQDKINESVERGLSVVFPSVSAQLEQKDRIRSAMIAPIMRKAGCFGIIYADNAMVHEHYALGDLDYLIFLAIHTAAILKNFIS